MHKNVRSVSRTTDCDGIILDIRVWCCGWQLDLYIIRNLNHSIDQVHLVSQLSSFQASKSNKVNGARRSTHLENWT